MVPWQFQHHGFSVNPMSVKSVLSPLLNSLTEEDNSILSVWIPDQKQLNNRFPFNRNKCKSVFSEGSLCVSSEMQRWGVETIAATPTGSFTYDPLLTWMVQYRANTLMPLPYSQWHPCFVWCFVWWGFCYFTWLLCKCLMFCLCNDASSCTLHLLTVQASVMIRDDILLVCSNEQLWKKNYLQIMWANNLLVIFNKSMNYIRVVLKQKIFQKQTDQWIWFYAPAMPPLVHRYSWIYFRCFGCPGNNLVPQPLHPQASWLPEKSTESITTLLLHFWGDRGMQDEL